MKAKNNTFVNKILTYIPFVGIAILFWVSSILSKNTTYSKDIWIKVIPQDSLILLNDSLHIANITLEGKGLNLVFVSKHDKSNPLKVYVESNTKYLEDRHIINGLNRELANHNVNIVKVIVPPSELIMETKLTKSVPIKFNGVVEPAKLFGLKSKIELNPARVTISGPKSLIQDIKEWNTEKKEYIKINKTINESIQLVKSKNPLISLHTKSITISIPIEEYTEKKLVIPVRIDGKNIEHLEITPSEVEISFMVGLSKYEGININDFSASVYIEEQLDANQNYPVSIVRKPSAVKIQYIQPNYIEVYKKL